jgi:hypothetical protein
VGLLSANSLLSTNALIITRNLLWDFFGNHVAIQINFLKKKSLCEVEKKK